MKINDIHISLITCNIISDLTYDDTGDNEEKAREGDEEAVVVCDEGSHIAQQTWFFSWWADVTSFLHRHIDLHQTHTSQ